MYLINILNERQLKLCSKAGAYIENKEYSIEELYQFEQKLLEYLNLYCVDEADEITELGEEYEDIIDLLVDYEEDNNPRKSNIETYLEENDRVKIKDGRTGTLVDITENMHTIEIDDKYKTGNIDEDILIVEASEIVEFSKPMDSIENLEDENRNTLKDE
ncbi:MAG: hypothetical protein HFJ43_06320 [Clostridia bacterium]|nr:hypothetical protein [Clostridia bacterium]